MYLVFIFLTFWERFGKGYSLEMDSIIQYINGTSDWNISMGRKTTTIMLIFAQSLIICEMLMYLILFYEQYTYNENLQMKKSTEFEMGHSKTQNSQDTEAKNKIGVSKQDLINRKQKNVVTLFGQFLSFLTEIIASTIVQIIYASSGTLSGIHHPTSIFTTAILTVSFILSSPELKRFYHINNE